MNNKAFTLIELLVSVAVVFCIVYAVLILPIFGLPFSTGEGQHTGYVSAVEKTGVIWKTGTAYIKTDPQSSQEDQYCVIDPQVYQELQRASDERDLITVNYRTVLIMSHKECGNEEGIITGIATSTK